MLFLLPPSETKRDGGAVDSVLDFDALSFGTLTKPRREAAASLVRVSRDVDASMKALRLGPRLRGEVERNRTLRSSPTRPALERYTGVAFDPIAAHSLSPDSWSWATAHVAIHSALFGLLGAADPIPAYRLSHNSHVPDLSLRALWTEPVRTSLALLERPVVDLRSEAYAELGPAPAGSVYVRVVSDADGRRRALNHFNKKTKGTLIARLVADRPELSSVDDFVEWAGGVGIKVERHGDELVLVSESVLSA